MNYVFALVILFIVQNGFSQTTSILATSGINASVNQHDGYSLECTEIHEQASWVGCALTKDETVSRFERTNRFIVDSLIKTGTATVEDYKGSGYDRGHLAPAADMAWSALSMSESFYFSNMSPQDPSFNRGIWKKWKHKYVHGQ